MSRISTQLPARAQLEVRDLELAIALATAGSTAAAAPLLNLTQSAISRALSQAESRLGVPLFERTARGLLPTAAGERLVQGAGVLLGELHALEREIVRPPAPPVRLRLVCECYTAYRWLPPVLSKLQEQTPELEVQIAIEHTRDPVRALLRHEIDVALLTTSQLPADSVELVCEPLFSDEVVFVLGSNHAYAHAEALTAAQLAAQPIITSHTPAAEGRWFMAKVFGRRKPKLRFLRLPLTEAIIEAARAGLGVAAVSEWMAAGYLDSGDLVVRRLSRGPLHRPWRLAYRRAARESAQRLKGILVASAPHLATTGTADKPSRDPAARASRGRTRPDSAKLSP